MPTLLELIADTEHRDLFRWWLAARGGREMPARTDFDPIEHPAFLPRLFLVTVNPVPPHFRYRLCGTEIDETQGYPMTGRSFEQLFSGELLRFTSDRFADVAFNRHVSYHSSHFSSSNTAKHNRFTRLLLPMSDDGNRVDTILGSRIEASDYRRSYDELMHDADMRERYEIAVVDTAAADRDPVRFVTV